MSSTFHYSDASGLDRKALRKPDNFVSVISDLFSNLISHWIGLVGLLAAFVVVGLGIGFWFSQKDQVSQKANSALFFADKALISESKKLRELEFGGREGSQGLAKGQAKGADKTAAEKSAAKSAIDAKEKKDSDAQSSANADGKATAENPEASAEAENEESLAQAKVDFEKLEVEKKFPETLSKLKDLERKYPNTRAAFEARLRIGGLYYRHGHSEQAIEWYEKARDSAQWSLTNWFSGYSNSFERTATVVLLGNAYENSGQLAKALESYQKALNLGEPSFKGEILLALGRTHEGLHDTAKAREVYDQILSDMPNTDYAKSAEISKAGLPVQTSQ